MRQDRGFTLIELLIVVAIIAIIAALRAISSSEANYASSCGSGGYAIDLADLAKPPPASVNAFISPDLSSNGVSKSGYLFAVVKNGNPATVDVVVVTCNAAGSTLASSFFAN